MLLELARIGERELVGASKVVRVHFCLVLWSYGQ